MRISKNFVPQAKRKLGKAYIAVKLEQTDRRSDRRTDQTGR